MLESDGKKARAALPNFAFGPKNARLGVEVGPRSFSRLSLTGQGYRPIVIDHLFPSHHLPETAKSGR